MRIEVTAEDIAKGERKQCLRCPITLALARAGVRSPRVDLNDGEATLEYADEAGELILPEECHDFIVGFDDGDHVEPFAFDIDVPAATPGTLGDGAGEAGK